MENLFNSNEKYEISDDFIVRHSDNAFIPFADGNKDYEQYKLWLDGGGVSKKYEEIKDRKTEILAELSNIDNKYRTLRTLSEAAIGNKFAISRLNEADEKAEILRKELAGLE